MARDAILNLYANVPLDPRYEHTLFWQDSSRQRYYFSNVASVEDTRATCVGQYQDFTHIRKNGTIKVPANFDDLNLMGVNYCTVFNDHKWYYYFVTDKRYISESVTELVIELDVMQTYQFDWDIPACFVEREHVSDDEPGNYLCDETLELGEMVVRSGRMPSDLKDLAIIMQASVDPRSGEAIKGGMIGGQYSGYKLYAFPGTNAGAAIVNTCIQVLETNGKADGIISMWMYPRNLVDAGWPEDISTVNTALEVKGIQLIEYMEGYPEDEWTTYTPRNKKLYTYPYSYLYAYNNQGEGAVLHYEMFDSNPIMRVGGNIANDGIARLVPMNYRGFAYDNESGISLTGFPTCAWNQDMYKIWMAQNANTQALSIQSGTVAMAAGAGTAAFSAVTLNGDGVGQGLSMAYSGYQQIAGVMAQRKDMQTHPPQSKGTQSSSCNIVLGIQSFTLAHMGVSDEYAKRIDQFFDMYGYRVNMVKVPNMTNRPMWNYVKTIGCVVKGGFDANARRKIAAIFDKGITLWKAPETMFRYDLAAGNVDV